MLANFFLRCLLVNKGSLSIPLNLFGFSLGMRARTLSDLFSLHDLHKSRRHLKGLFKGVHLPRLICYPTSFAVDRISK